MIVSFSAVVQRYGEEIFSAVPEDLRSGLKWEHVGSTSIKVQLLQTFRNVLILLQGMPGTKNPDALLMVPQFPPPRPVIQALLNCGYYFGSVAPMDSADLWWFKNIQEGTEILLC